MMNDWHWIYILFLAAICVLMYMIWSDNREIIQSNYSPCTTTYYHVDKQFVGYPIIE